MLEKIPSDAALKRSALSLTTASPLQHLYIVLEEVVRKRAEIFERYDGDIAWQHTEVDVPRKELERIAKAMVEPKEELRRLILDPAMGQLDKLFNELNLQDDDEADLYTISVNFQVFRHLGYKLSCGLYASPKLGFCSGFGLAQVRRFTPHLLFLSIYSICSFVELSWRSDTAKAFAVIDFTGFCLNYRSCEKGCILLEGVMRMGRGNSNSQSHNHTPVNLLLVKIWDLILPLSCPSLHDIQPC
ncbi:hypothetical protein L6452_17119 [Arctium lappa]|uniref:Uncharacterized protein n=1 Tax=Arctium lappa TaxID=4217 RepID=A0ACB9C2H3_ARCLA|nr:hypothetical protein L6452_17119 [Arctium lappa]